MCNQQDLNETELLNDQATSHWLREQIESSKKRDVCDALADAEALVALLRQRFSVLSNANATLYLKR